ncbi:MAG: methylmalonyl Co-A mutase-associated GTPase MeaB [Kiloniellales bacterium]
MHGADTSALEALRRGGKAAMAKALAALEREPDSATSLALLNAAYAAPRARVIGVTGPPGVGKSTLLGALIGLLRRRSETVAVIAVDPSSKRSGGALLGDRLRLISDPEDEGLFVRSMAARDRLGGLAAETMAAMVLMRALYDVVLIETVGVGQSETDVAGAADTVVFCVQPGSGDSLQFMKAGIVEIPQVAVVTKADQGAAAVRALADLRGALSLGAASDGWEVAVFAVSAQTRQGLDDLVAALDRHAAYLAAEGRLAAARHAQAEHWLREAVRSRFGTQGVKRAGDLTLDEGESPFARVAAVSAELTGKDG